MSSSSSRPTPAVTRRSALAAGLLGVGGAIVAACSRSGSSAAPARTGGPSARPSTSSTPPPDPASVHANELGLVPVLMHHRVTDAVDSEYDMTPAYYRAELERLYAEGYHPVTVLDLVHGSFDRVPAGKTPVVMTFDDGSSGQFGYTATGTIKPESGAGILLDFNREHPDFPAVASFYINRDPFAISDTSKALTDLHRRGFEIGNHTYHHANLKQLDASHVQAELGALQEMVEQAVPGLRPRTMALPLGVSPRDPALVKTGMFKGQRYVNEGVLLVGANPSHSPFHKSFDPQAIPRIRSSSYNGGKGDYLAAYWLDYLKAHPTQRYRSAGNPGHVTFPRSFVDVLHPRLRRQAIAY